MALAVIISQETKRRKAVSDTREILFRGKRKDNREWVEGYLFDDGMVDSKRMFIGSLVITEHKGLGKDVWDIGHAFYEVLHETVGQYAGLTDKNGKKIFEGDVVNEYDMPEEISNTGIVQWSEMFMGWNISQTRSMYCHKFMSYEVIGNIYDNPELLKGK